MNELHLQVWRDSFKLANPFTIEAQDSQVFFNVASYESFQTSDNVLLNWSFESDLGIERVYKGKANLTHIWEGTTDKVIRLGFPDGNWSRLLTGMNFSNKQMKGVIDPIINEMVNLTGSVSFYQCKMTTPFPNINNLVNVDYISLAINETFNGELHPSVFTLPSISRIQMEQAGVTGSIPSTISLAQNLTEFDASSTNLYGVIPEEVWLLPKLESFGVSGGDMSLGTNNINYCKTLNYLDLRRNNLTGSLPDLSGINNLNQLYLSENSFTGGFSNFFSNINNNIGRCWIDGSGDWGGNYIQGDLLGKKSINLLMRVCGLSSNDVDNILLDALENARNIPNADFSLAVSRNEPPSAIGLAAKNEMINDYGLTITTD